MTRLKAEGTIFKGIIVNWCDRFFLFRCFIFSEKQFFFLLMAAFPDSDSFFGLMIIVLSIH